MTSFASPAYIEQAFPGDTAPPPPLSIPENPATPVEPIGVIICKKDIHKSNVDRGYIAMLSVVKAWRKRGIARTLLTLSVDAMTASGAKEVVLETEFDNTSALAFYSSMGFMREKRLFRFYMNGKDAFRLVLPLTGDEEDELDNNSSDVEHYPMDQGPAPEQTAGSALSSSLETLGLKA